MPLRLVLRNMTAHWVRTLLTVASLTVAVFLLCFLRSVVVSLESAVVASATNRLITQSAVSLFIPMPLSYQGKVDQVDGVASTMKMNWFGGYYQTQKNFFAQFAVDAERLAENYPEIQIIEGSFDEFVKRRTSCLIGKGLSEKYGWKMGDRVPITSAIYPRIPLAAWEFDVAGIYESKRDNVDNNTLWFQHDYLRESIETEAASGQSDIGVLVIRLASPSEVARVSAAVDALFVNGPQRVRTTTEAEFQRQFVGMFGNVPTFLSAIGSGVVFAILLAVVNTMLMAARERTHSVGVMKALGFKDSAVAGLIVVESLVICLLGATCGVLLGKLSEAALLKSGMGVMFPGYRVGPDTMVAAVVGCIVVALIAALVPALQLMKLRPVEALRSEA